MVNTMKRPIYLDYAASTPIDPRVLAKMNEAMQKFFGNPSSNHQFGQAAKELIEEARQHVANLIHADPSEVIWTSGATESNNLALKGAAENYKGKGRHIITLKTEHPSVLDCCQQLEKNGFSVTYLEVEKNGLLDLEKFQASLRADTILVSVMQVNNEIGVIQDIQKIATLTAARGILCHVDAAQSAGKIPINVSEMPIDMMSFSAHKMYGPKGVGALYLRRKPRVRVAPLIHGGGQEQGMRSGTLATHQIVGMGEAFRLAQQEMQSDQERITIFREQFLQGIKEYTYYLNGGRNSLPNILSLRFPNMSGDELIQQLSALAISAGSACLSKGTSYVLRALGQSESDAKSTLRISFGRFTTAEEINFALAKMQSVKSY